MRRSVRLLLLVGSFASLEAGAMPATSLRLGIADVRTIESANRTVMTAVDDRGQPVARLELVHGRFMPTGELEPAFRGREVDGRQLFVEVKGQTIAWETIGFTDTSQMPPLSPDLNLVAAFLADGRVRPVLEKWRIGWAATGAAAASARRPRAMAPNEFTYSGTNPTECSGSGICPLRGGNTSLCNGFAGHQGLVVSQDFATFGHDEDIVSMCCGSATSGTYAVKTCAVAATGGLFVSSCGASPGRCKACAGTQVPYSTSCTLSARETGQVNAEGLPIYLVHHCDAAPETPPTITVGPPTEIWPPNQKMHSFTLADFASAMDACDNRIDVNAAGTITSITSNEPGSNDIVITGSSSFSVRAERNGTGRGRVYEINFSVQDASGNSAPGVYVVNVPHDRGGLAPIVR